MLNYYKCSSVDIKKNIICNACHTSLPTKTHSCRLYVELAIFNRECPVINTGFKFPPFLYE